MLLNADLIPVTLKCFLTGLKKAKVPDNPVIASPTIKYIKSSSNTHKIKHSVAICQ